MKTKSAEVKTQSIPSFQTTRREAEEILEIVRRADKMNLLQKDRLQLDMDITACHANGCPLDLVKLLKADDFNFAHDVCGIQRHINRENGQLLNCFLPRSARHDKPSK